MIAFAFTMKRGFSYEEKFINSSADEVPIPSGTLPHLRLSARPFMTQFRVNSEVFRILRANIAPLAEFDSTEVPIG
jgi:hypothetical protein